MLRLKVVGVGVYARFPQRIYLAAPLEQEFAEFFHGGGTTFHGWQVAG
jgi:hypothetical protein